MEKKQVSSWFYKTTYTFENKILKLYDERR
jgi:hypothetical protein